MTTSPLNNGRDRTQYRNRSPPELSSARNCDGNSLHARSGQYPFYSPPDASRRQFVHSGSPHLGSSKYYSEGRHSGRHASGSSRHHLSRPPSSDSSRTRPAYDCDMDMHNTSAFRGGHRDEDSGARSPFRSGRSTFSDGSRRSSLESPHDRVSSRRSRESFEGGREIRRDGGGNHDGEEARSYFSWRGERTSQRRTSEEAPSERQRGNATRGRPRVITFEHNAERRRENENAEAQRLEHSPSNQNSLDKAPTSPIGANRVKHAIVNAPCESVLNSSSPCSGSVCLKTKVLPSDDQNNDLVICSTTPSTSSTLLSTENFHNRPPVVTVTNNEEHSPDVLRIPAADISKPCPDFAPDRKDTNEGAPDKRSNDVEPSKWTQRSYLSNRNRRDVPIVNAEVAYSESNQINEGNANENAMVELSKCKEVFAEYGPWRPHLRQENAFPNLHPSTRRALETLHARRTSDGTGIANSDRPRRVQVVDGFFSFKMAQRYSQPPVAAPAAKVPANDGLRAAVNGVVAEPPVAETPNELPDVEKPSSVSAADSAKIANGPVNGESSAVLSAGSRLQAAKNIRLSVLRAERDRRSTRLQVVSSSRVLDAGAKEAASGTDDAASKRRGSVLGEPEERECKRPRVDSDDKNDREEDGPAAHEAPGQSGVAGDGASAAEDDASIENPPKRLRVSNSPSEIVGMEMVPKRKCAMEDVEERLSEKAEISSSEKENADNQEVAGKVDESQDVGESAIPEHYSEPPARVLAPPEKALREVIEDDDVHIIQPQSSVLPVSDCGAKNEMISLECEARGLVRLSPTEDDEKAEKSPDSSQPGGDNEMSGDSFDKTSPTKRRTVGFDDVSSVSPSKDGEDAKGLCESPEKDDSRTAIMQKDEDSSASTLPAELSGESNRHQKDSAAEAVWRSSSASTVPAELNGESNRLLKDSTAEAERSPSASTVPVELSGEFIRHQKDSTVESELKASDAEDASLKPAGNDLSADLETCSQVASKNDVEDVEALETPEANGGRAKRKVEETFTITLMNAGSGESAIEIVSNEEFVHQGSKTFAEGTKEPEKLDTGESDVNTALKASRVSYACSQEEEIECEFVIEDVAYFAVPSQEEAPAKIDSPIVSDQISVNVPETVCDEKVLTEEEVFAADDIAADNEVAEVTEFTSTLDSLDEVGDDAQLGSVPCRTTALEKSYRLPLTKLVGHVRFRTRQPWLVRGWRRRYNYGGASITYTSVVPEATLPTLQKGIETGRESHDLTCDSDTDDNVQITSVCVKSESDNGDDVMIIRSPTSVKAGADELVSRPPIMKEEVTDSEKTVHAVFEDISPGSYSVAASPPLPSFFTNFTSSSTPVTASSTSTSTLYREPILSTMFNVQASQTPVCISSCAPSDITPAINTPSFAVVASMTTHQASVENRGVRPGTSEFQGTMSLSSSRTNVIDVLNSQQRLSEHSATTQASTPVSRQSQAPSGGMLSSELSQLAVFAQTRFQDDSSSSVLPQLLHQQPQRPPQSTLSQQSSQQKTYQQEAVRFQQTIQARTHPLHAASVSLTTPRQTPPPLQQSQPQTSKAPPQPPPQPPSQPQQQKSQQLMVPPQSHLQQRQFTQQPQYTPQQQQTINVCRTVASQDIPIGACEPQTRSSQTRTTVPPPLPAKDMYLRVPQPGMLRATAPGVLTVPQPQPAHMATIRPTGTANVPVPQTVHHQLHLQQQFSELQHQKQQAQKQQAQKQQQQFSELQKQQAQKQQQQFSELQLQKQQAQKQQQQTQQSPSTSTSPQTQQRPAARKRHIRPSGDKTAMSRRPGYMSALSNVDGVIRQSSIHYSCKDCDETSNSLEQMVSHVMASTGNHRIATIFVGFVIPSDQVSHRSEQYCLGCDEPMLTTSCWRKHFISCSTLPVEVKCEYCVSVVSLFTYNFHITRVHGDVVKNLPDVMNCTLYVRRRPAPVMPLYVSVFRWLGLYHAYVLISRAFYGLCVDPVEEVLVQAFHPCVFLYYCNACENFFTRVRNSVKHSSNCPRSVWPSEKRVHVWPMLFYAASESALNCMCCLREITPLTRQGLLSHLPCFMTSLSFSCHFPCATQPFNTMLQLISHVVNTHPENTLPGTRDFDHYDRRVLFGRVSCPGVVLPLCCSRSLLPDIAAEIYRTSSAISLSGSASNSSVVSNASAGSRVSISSATPTPTARTLPANSATPTTSTSVKDLSVSKPS